jgi:hypothetical protein
MLKFRPLAAALVAALTLTTPGVAAAETETQTAAERAWVLMIFTYGTGAAAPGHLMSQDSCATAAQTHKEILSFGGRTLVAATCTNVITGEVVEH